MSLLFGVPLLLLGLAGLSSRLRPPGELMLTDEGLGLPTRGGRQWIAWSDVVAVEPVSRTSALRVLHMPLPGLRFHLIVLRDAAGRPLATIPVSTLATDRETALRAVRERWAAATGREG